MIISLNYFIYYKIKNDWLILNIINQSLVIKNYERKNYYLSIKLKLLAEIGINVGLPMKSSNLDALQYDIAERK